jgi:hypothetical protein
MIKPDMQPTATKQQPAEKLGKVFEEAAKHTGRRAAVEQRQWAEARARQEAAKRKTTAD